MNRLHVYSVQRNEHDLLPHWLRYYTELAERVVIYDNYSDERTHQIYAEFPSAEIIPWGNPDEHDDLELNKHMNQAWKQSRAAARWVLWADGDEFVWHPNLCALLDQTEATVLKPQGYEMCPPEDLTEITDSPLWEQIQWGNREEMYSKTCLFRPDKVNEINWQIGAHRARPAGNVNLVQPEGLRLLHFRYLGAEWYHRTRVLSRGDRLSGRNLKEKNGLQWQASLEQIKARMAKLRCASERLMFEYQGTAGQRTAEVLSELAKGGTDD